MTGIQIRTDSSGPVEDYVDYTWQSQQLVGKKQSIFEHANVSLHIRLELLDQILAPATGFSAGQIDIGNAWGISEEIRVQVVREANVS